MTAVLGRSRPPGASDPSTNGNAKATRAPGLRSMPARQRRMPWIALGLLLVFGSGLAFAAWSKASSTRVAVLVAARDLDAGEVLTADAVRTEEVAAGPAVAVVTPAQRSLLIGMVARGPIASGTLLARTMVTDGGVVPAGQAVVGAVLDPGAYPTAALRAGDRVDLIATAGENGTDAAAGSLGSATVWSITDAGAADGSEREFISLLVMTDRATAVTNAAAHGQLRLVLVGGGS
jgi:Flp pilus assembly protein CpaB